MSPRTGRPKVENPKDTQLKIRADKETIDDLEECCSFFNKNKSEIIRMGIQEVKSKIKK